MKNKGRNQGYGLVRHLRLSTTERWGEDPEGVINLSNLLEDFCDICEGDGAITKVDAEYYEEFLNYSDKEMKAIIFHILNDRVNDFNRLLRTNEWQAYGGMFQYVKDHLWLVALGILGFHEGTHRLAYSKPEGSPASEEIANKLMDKIDNSVSLIKEVIRAMLPNK